MRQLVLLASFVLVAASGAALSVLGASCLVDSRCVSDLDCPFPQRCGADGLCALECGASSPDTCPEDRPQCLVSENRCVECVDATDCPADEECITYSCVPSMAPEFALTDQNPDSPSFGQEVALSDQVGKVVLVFFAGLG